MKKDQPALDGRSFLLGIAAGAAAAVGMRFLDRDSHLRFDQDLVDRALDRSYRQAARQGAIRLDGQHRYIIFSDHHKGARNGADDFRQCEQTYLAALDYYSDLGYTLVILGDGEELLEERIEDVMNAYQNVLAQEARFYPDCLVRVYGNHDFSWAAAPVVRRHMDPLFPGIQYRESLLFRYGQGGPDSGELFLIHGYQGTFDGDLFPFAARLTLPLYRKFQIRTGFGRTDPSRDACLRSKHDNRLYRWVSTKEKLILVAGHTHRPVWSSKTHLEKLTDELYDLLQLDPGLQPENYADLVEEKKREIERRRAKFPPCDDMIKIRPAYFNTGCCRFADGDITGIELENGLIRLIKWGQNEGAITRSILEENELGKIFLYL